MKLVWSRLAIAELQALRTHSIEHWGREVASTYLSDVRAAARRTAARPAQARRLTGPFGLVRVRSHYLIVEIDEPADRLTVARVLHIAMDLERHLPAKRQGRDRD